MIYLANVNLIAIGPGSFQNAKEFCRITEFPIENLYLDTTTNADIYQLLQFNKGFLPESNISPYLKLLPMLIGIGSPGTIGEVIRGYLGDKSSSSNWIKRSLK